MSKGFSLPYFEGAADAFDRESAVAFNQAEQHLTSASCFRGRAEQFRMLLEHCKDLEEELRASRRLSEEILRIFQNTECSCDASVGYVCEACHFTALALRCQRKDKGTSEEEEEEDHDAE